jgi:hypothetical protein
MISPCLTQDGFDLAYVRFHIAQGVPAQTCGKKQHTYTFCHNLTTKFIHATINSLKIKKIERRPTGYASPAEHLPTTHSPSKLKTTIPAES